jgi:hypothetical protein
MECKSNHSGQGQKTGMLFTESPASSSDDCPNHNFWIARHPMGVSKLFAAYAVRTRRLSAGDPGEVRSRRLHRKLYRLFHFGTRSRPFVRTFESTMAISTRRLAARACSLLPGMRGSDLPKPLVLMIVGEIPVCTKKSRTASARRRESCKL